METPETPQNNEEPEDIQSMAKVWRINLVVVLVYAVLLFISGYIGGNGDLMEWVIIVGMAMMAHGVINLILGVIFFIAKKPGWGKGALLSGLVLLLIGFSSCTAAFSQTGFH